MSDSAVGLADALDADVLLQVLAQARRGDFTARMPLSWTGVAGQVANELNHLIVATQALESELAKASEPPQHHETSPQNSESSWLRANLERFTSELVGLLGGEIAAFGAPGQGHTFTVHLAPSHSSVGAPDGATSTRTALIPELPPDPVAVGEEMPSKVNPEFDYSQPDNRDENDFDGTRVLVVDDDYRNLFAMTAWLERGHAVVTVAESGPAAVASLERTPDVDIVLMDIMMPGMDGYATMRAIRAFDKFKTLPIIAVTGKVTPDERQRCIDAGATDYVSKPVDLVRFLAVLKAHVPRLWNPGDHSAVLQSIV
jgi:CheY-like chemotaxis protein